MNFNSFGFLFFIAAAALIYPRLSPEKRRLYLLTVSCLYYAFWSLPHLLLLLAAAGVSYRAGLRIAAAGSERSKERTLALAVLVLLAALAFFRSGGLHWLAPVGISYYTFKTISYVVDVYWEKMPPERDFVSYAAYVAFFPQILSGPIQRAADFLPRLARAEAPSSRAVVEGVRLILFGLFKKIAVADGLARIVDQVYLSPGAHHGWPLLLAIDCFFIQLYADFSGLTDIAIGTALLFGIRSPQNFDAPLYASNLKEFWRRWHMTLTAWLTDYLFTPLWGFLRDRGALGLAVSVFATMLAIGSWHGARWTFLIYGAINGVNLVVSIFTLPSRDRFFKRHDVLAALRRFTAPLVTFHLMAASLVFFRAAKVSDALTILGNLPRSSGADAALTADIRPNALVLLILAVAAMEAVHLHRRSEACRRALARWPESVVAGAYYLALIFFLLMSSGSASPQFIYFWF